MSTETLLGAIANKIGAPEPALRLLVSILLGYPLAIIHRNFLFGKSHNLQHLFFIACGLCIGYFNYGLDICHSAVSVFVVYLILTIFGGTLVSVISVFIFCMTYLLVAYYNTGTETYDIKWSMPQCVLTLRLIGLAFDVYDGKKPANKWSSDQKKTALLKTPSLLEVAGHTYFFGSFLVGPQFPMKKYQEFVSGIDPTQHDGKQLPDCLMPALKRGSLGFLYLGIYQIGAIYFPDTYLLSPEFEDFPFWRRCIIIGVWGKITLYKYISCWLISEGVCIATGLTYNGRDTDGQILWDGCANVKLRIFEGATKFGHFINSFNINTNNWVSQYIYKRLKFLGNRYISQASTLIFLAVWHGLHSGYYMCFFMEFIIMTLEKEVEPIFAKSEVQELFNNPIVSKIINIVLKLYTFVFLGYSLVPFALLSFNRWWQVYKSVYFVGHVFFMTWPLYVPFLKKLLYNSKDKKQE